MKQKKYPKPKKDAWFIPVRRSYLPSNWKGWASYVPFIGILVGATLWEVHTKESFGASLIHLFPFYIAVGVVMQWFASSKS